MSTDPVALLSELVSFRSDLVHGDERALAEHLAVLLRARKADEVALVETPRPEGKATSYVYARYGKPRRIVNAHLDTVPPNADWSSDPFQPKIEGGRIYALGAADTKGAAAAILSALDDTTPTDTGILFSGDEEFSSVAMRAFVASEHRRGIEHAIVCEPTNLQPGIRHRGFIAFEVTVSGPGGHSSLADTLPAPVARLSRLAVALDEWGTQHRGRGPEGFPGMCLNLAKLDGGVAFNVIPAQAALVVSLRPPPGANAQAISDEIEAIVREVVPEGRMHFLRKNAPFATKDIASFTPYIGERETLDLGFWTEAAVLAENGVDVVVLGPGNIAQAHAPDEWVEIDELRKGADLFRRVFAKTRV